MLNGSPINQPLQAVSKRSYILPGRLLNQGHCKKLWKDPLRLKHASAVPLLLLLIS